MFQRLDRYILKELLGPFLLGLLILTMILVMQQIIALMELVLDKGVDLITIGQLFLRLLPSFFLITIPIAVLMSTVTTFNRLSADNEIIAFQAGGIRFFRLLRPVLVFAIIVSGLTLFMGITSGNAKGSYNKIALKLLVKQASVGLEERQFNGVFSDMMIYVDSMPSFSELNGVFIFDQRNKAMPTVIVAKRGIIMNDEATKTIGLHLMDGSLQQGEKNSRRYQRMVFESYDLKIDLASLVKKNTASDIPSYAEIKERIAKAQGEDLGALRLLSDFYKRFLFSVAAFVFCILGVPLGILSGRIARMGGFVAGIGIILFYYMLMVLGDYLISIRVFPPIAAAAFPILVLIPFCVMLIKKVGDNASPTIFGLKSKRP
ncbi:LptF/LptG family permease [Nitrospira defluvii]|nr:LptF/LptG family permease [Nitrospira defluvii]